MKRLYKKFVRWLHNFGYSFERKVIFLLEWYAILRKRKLYKHIKWTKEQKREFDNYWKKHYGKKISPRWHKLYEALSGTYRINYIPEIIFTTKIEPTMNDYNYCKVLSDKNLLGILFDNRIKGVRTPKTIIANSNGCFYDAELNVISKKNALEIINDIGFAVVKPTVDSSSGKNVSIVNIQNGIDVRKNIGTSEIFDAYKSNFVVQEKIFPHKELSTLYPNSINTFRIISYMIDGVIDIAPLSMRIGGCNSEVDNIHAGGMSIKIDKNGHLAKYAYRLGYGDSSEKLVVHPNTNIEFGTYSISYVGKLVDAAKALHSFLPHIGVVSWDLTIDSDGNIVIVEANLKGQSAWFPQMLSGEPLFGENTDKVLKCVRKKK